MIRAALASDCDRLNDITQSSSAYANQYRAMLEGYIITREQIERDVFFVAELSGRVVAYYSLTREPEPELDLTFVADEAQGTGIGKTLFEHMLATARGLGMESVKIVSHPPSVGFYERMGAQRIGAQPPRGRVTWERPILRVATKGA